MGTLRWIGLGLAGLLVIALGFVGWVYAASEAHFRSFAAPAPFAAAIPEDEAAVARGERLAKTRGCYGCHGESLEGEIMWGAIVTPNLPAMARVQTPAALEAAIRHGVGVNGRALFSMPSYNFARMSDADLADLIAFLRATPVSTNAPAGKWRPLHERIIGEFIIRMDIARGKDAAMPHHLPLVPQLKEANNPDPRIARGEYLALTSCNECHGMTLRGDYPWPDAAPDLIVMGAYGPEDFTKLMREGVPISGAELEMMGPVARGRFVHWTDGEVDDLYAYLSHMAKRAVEAESGG